MKQNEGLPKDEVDNASPVEDSIANPGKAKKKKKRHYKQKYCGGCWRVEKHFALNRNKSRVVFLAILTLGVYLLVRRFKCRVCGRIRLAIGE